MSLQMVSSRARPKYRRVVLRGAASPSKALAHEVSIESLEVVASCSLWEESS